MTAAFETVWRQRAARLARPAAPPEPGVLTVLVVRLGEERYALDLAAVAEVAPTGHLSPVPGAAAMLAGVMALRSQIRPVWDLARLLGLAAGATPGGGYVVLLRTNAGLWVEGLEGIRRLTRTELPEGRRVTADLVAVLDLEALRKEMER